MGYLYFSDLYESETGAMCICVLFQTATEETAEVPLAHHSP